jgi:hypothetical protein
MQVIQAPNYGIIENRKTLFLGGGISNCPDWQSEVVKAFEGENITLFNPRRDDFDISKKKESKIQIKWEYKFLREAGAIMFWFPKETICPITLFELGGAIERRQPIFLGCHPDYQRRFDLEIQTSLLIYPIKVHTSLNSLIKNIKSFYL